MVLVVFGVNICQSRKSAIADVMIRVEEPILSRVVCNTHICQATFFGNRAFDAYI